jgi:hypothetical protein
MDGMMYTHLIKISSAIFSYFASCYFRYSRIDEVSGNNRNSNEYYDTCVSSFKAQYEKLLAQHALDGSKEELDRLEAQEAKKYDACFFINDNNTEGDEVINLGGGEDNDPILFNRLMKGGGGKEDSEEEEDDVRRSSKKKRRIVDSDDDE